MRGEKQQKGRGDGGSYVLREGAVATAKRQVRSALGSTGPAPAAGDGYEGEGRSATRPVNGIEFSERVLFYFILFFRLRVASRYQTAGASNAASRQEAVVRLPSLWEAAAERLQRGCERCRGRWDQCRNWRRARKKGCAASSIGTWSVFFWSGAELWEGRGRGGGRGSK